MWHALIRPRTSQTNPVCALFEQMLPVAFEPWCHLARAPMKIHGGPWGLRARHTPSYINKVPNHMARITWEKYPLTPCPVFLIQFMYLRRQAATPKRRATNNRSISRQTPSCGSRPGRLYRWALSRGHTTATCNPGWMKLPSRTRNSNYAPLYGAKGGQLVTHSTLQLVAEN